MLKKFSRVLVTLFFILSICFAYLVNARPIFLDYGGEYEIYFLNGSFTAPQKTNSKILPLGVKGEACTIYDKTAEELFSDFNADVIFIEEIDGGINYYGYSPKIRYTQSINGKIVNLHVFVGKEKIKVGTPIIFGSY